MTNLAPVNFIEDKKGCQKPSPIIKLTIA